MVFTFNNAKGVIVEFILNEYYREVSDVFAVIRELAEMLRAPELKSLRRAFNVWKKGLLKRQTRDSKIVEKIDGLTLLWKP